MLLGMLYSCHWCWSGPGWLTSTFDPKIAFFLILPTMEKNRGIFSPGPGKRPKMAIFSKFFFRTFFYHPEIPSCLYGATVDLWQPHGVETGFAFDRAPKIPGTLDLFAKPPTLWRITRYHSSSAGCVGAQIRVLLTPVNFFKNPKKPHGIHAFRL